MRGYQTARPARTTKLVRATKSEVGVLDKRCENIRQGIALSEIQHLKDQLCNTELMLEKALYRNKIVKWKAESQENEIKQMKICIKQRDERIRLLEI